MPILRHLNLKQERYLSFLAPGFELGAVRNRRAPPGAGTRRNGLLRCPSGPPELGGGPGQKGAPWGFRRKSAAFGEIPDAAFFYLGRELFSSKLWLAWNAVVCRESSLGYTKIYLQTSRLQAVVCREMICSDIIMSP